jgi:hypothetical protein
MLIAVGQVLITTDFMLITSDYMLITVGQVPRAAPRRVLDPYGVG